VSGGGIVCTNVPDGEMKLNGDAGDSHRRIGVFRKTSQLKGCAVQATDGAIGEAVTVLFDDEAWTVRHLVVDTGKWLPGRKVLISPLSVLQVDWTDRRVQVSLTREQVKNSPDIDSDRPVSRQHESDFYRYYGYPHYWGGTGLWGSGDTAEVLARADDARAVAEMRARDMLPKDVHLRDAAAVAGYHVRAADGEIGHVQDFLIDDRTWLIRYLVIDTSNWLGGRLVIVSPDWVSRVSWSESTVDTAAARGTIAGSPPFTDVDDLSAHYEQRLREHYRAALVTTR
jgi:hypothetical protein